MEVYILESLVDHSHYIGISKSAKTRLLEHNSGKTQSTRNKKPWIIYIEQASDLKKAREREKYLKSYRGVKEKKEIIKNSEVV